MRCIFASVFVTLNGALHFLQYPADACPVRPYSSDINVLRLLDEALNSSQDGVVRLQISNADQPSGQPSPPAGFVVVREPEGRNVTLPCGDNIIAQRPLIRYNGRQLPANGGPLDPTPLHLCSCKINPSDNFWISGITLWSQVPFVAPYSLRLYNFTHRLSGTYECLHIFKGEPAVYNRYLISPRLIPKKVFQPPMANATSTVGKKAEFRCAVKFDAMPSSPVGFGDRFLWTDNQDLIYAPGVAAFQRDVRIRPRITVKWPKMVACATRRCTSSECREGTKGAISAALQLLDEALKSNRDGVVRPEILSQPSSVKLQSAGLIVIREPEGKDVILPCGDNTTAQPSLIRYNGRQVSAGSNQVERPPVFHCSCKILPPDYVWKSETALLKHRASPTYFIRLINFSYQLSGTYE
ncbi:uncharacterized protein LOC129581418 [Paramacrobiotus metropolitanus]|uniref:uncharacterized protein LOC129581418 n=1 Tax=Paramacrobiotus metropolitanus TaxID=2943436 RepID=UPI002445E65A|nr:uncharacterized protein LOC129581418 [Paramacrobiotus metropolitanus]